MRSPGLSRCVPPHTGWPFLCRPDAARQLLPPLWPGEQAAAKLSGCCPLQEEVLSPACSLASLLPPPPPAVSPKRGRTSPCGGPVTATETGGTGEEGGEHGPRGGRGEWGCRRQRGALPARWEPGEVGRTDKGTHSVPSTGPQGHLSPSTRWLGLTKPHRFPVRPFASSHTS